MPPGGAQEAPGRGFSRSLRGGACRLKSWGRGKTAEVETPFRENRKLGHSGRGNKSQVHKPQCTQESSFDLCLVLFWVWARILRGASPPTRDAPQARLQSPWERGGARAAGKALVGRRAGGATQGDAGLGSLQPELKASPRGEKVVSRLRVGEKEGR